MNKNVYKIMNKQVLLFYNVINTVNIIEDLKYINNS